MTRSPERFSGIAGEEENPLAEAKTEQAPEKSVAELEPYRLEAQSLLDSYRPFFLTFARDVSLDFKLSNGFFIDLEKGVVHLDTKWFKEKGFSKTQTLWAVLHELSHFRDLADDPERMMQNFDDIVRKAGETGGRMMGKWEAKYGETDPELIERLKRRKPFGSRKGGKTLNAVESAAYKIHHTFSNVFDDIFVNVMVSRRAPAFEADEPGGEDVAKLYREKLFSGTDYRNLPRHLQFLYALLRQEMVPNERVEIGSDAEEALGRQIKFQGREQTPKEIVERFLKPGKKKDTKAGQRYFVLKKTLEPIFTELLGKDLDEWDPVKPEPQPPGEPGGEPQEGDPNPFADEYDEFAENSPDQMDEEEIQDWLDKQQDDKEKEKARQAQARADDRKTPEQRAADAQDELDKAWGEANGIAPETLRGYREIEAEVAPHLQELSEVWEKIISGASREVKREVEGNFVTGTELDMQKVIDEFPRIESGEADEVRVMKRDVMKETLVRRPELIRVRLVGDLSGSMDGAKKRMLERCFVLILSSLHEFTTKLNLTRDRTKTDLTADTEARVFGSSTKKIKSFREGAAGDEQAEIVRIYEKLKANLGMTADFLALEAIADSVTPEEKDRLEKGKTLDIVFEITDGGSDNVARTRGSVDRLLENGIAARAFQIGAVSEEERQAFEEAWNAGREEPAGQVVGEKIENLIPSVVEALKKFMRGVRL